MKIKNDRHKRYNRRRDGVTTIQSTPERHKLEESRLNEQWDEFWKEENSDPLKDVHYMLERIRNTK